MKIREFINSHSYDENKVYFINSGKSKFKLYFKKLFVSEYRSFKGYKHLMILLDQDKVHILKIDEQGEVIEDIGIHSKKRVMLVDGVYYDSVVTSFTHLNINYYG